VISVNAIRLHFADRERCVAPRASLALNTISLENKCGYFPNKQLDYENSPWELWTWTSNVVVGLEQNTANNPRASAHWSSSVSAWNSWNSAHPTAPVSMQSNLSEGPCTFSYTPAAGQHPFSDAIWIKMYNSDTMYWYLTFSNGAWVVNTTNGSSFDYVFRVCSATS
jgi:hypothetical protein